MWNLAFDVAFELVTAKPDRWTDKEWLDALKKRVIMLEANPDELHEAAQ